MKLLQSLKLSPFHSIQITFLALFISLPVFFGGCIASKMAPYDAIAHERAKTIKTAAEELIGMATEDYSTHEPRVGEFQTMVDRQIELEVGRGEKNQKTVSMWNLLMNPNEKLMGGFLKRWKEQGKLSQTFVDEIRPLVARNIDKILNLESKKSGGPGV